MESIYVFKKILVLFILIGVGYYAVKRKFINDEGNTCISNFIVNITLPMLILISFQVEFSKDILVTIMKLFIFSFCTFIITIIIGKVLFSKMNNEKGDILKFVSIFSNCGFIGFPILKIVYGQDGVLYASIFNFVYNLFVWSIGIIILGNKENKINYKKVIKNPNILAVILGSILMISSIELPYFIKESCDMVGNMTAPLSMIVIGGMLTKVNLKESLKDRSLYLISILRLFIIPLGLWGILYLLKVDSSITNIIVICQAMPAATLCPILAKTYGRNYKYASEIVVVTTLFSMISIPIIITLLTST